jgi:hypothetical protein
VEIVLWILCHEGGLITQKVVDALSQSAWYDSRVKDRSDEMSDSNASSKEESRGGEERMVKGIEREREREREKEVE